MTLEPKGQLYVVSVSAAGFAILFECIATLLRNPVGPDWLILAGLTFFSGFFTIKVPQLHARLSVSETFVFASVLLFGTCAGTLIVALDILVSSLRFRRRSPQPIRVAFNVGAGAISIFAAGQIFYTLSGIRPLAEVPTSLPEIFLPLIALATSYFLFNSVLVAFALSLERRANAFTIWKNNFLWLSVNYFGGASVAALLVSYTQSVDIVVLGTIGPLLIITYLTFKTSFNRIDDATRHLDEVNRLYLSTIETLATAIDAKDQVTHGHIRRVQRHTLALAKELGVKDETQLKALEAAALLHDTGKLVVPEHILNKPGRLSAGEYERMKLHAAAGADILSAINFPYPVVPIVRHHHENWDGSGYPDGLRGTDIPIGARILSVIDCFDALTSDRPYRRRLSDREAMDILMQRRGTMYDPLIVDTFATVKESLDATASENELPTAEGVSGPRETDARSSSLPVRRQADDDFVRAGQTVLGSLLEATSATLAILYLRDYSSDTSIAVVASPSLGREYESNTMPLGSGITGWVIANGRSMVNADAALDFAAAPSPKVSRCVSVPLVVEGETVGALACYIDNLAGFSEREVAVMEMIAGTFSSQPLQSLIRRALAKVPRTAAARSVH